MVREKKRRGNVARALVWVLVVFFVASLAFAGGCGKGAQTAEEPKKPEGQTEQASASKSEKIVVRDGTGREVAFDAPVRRVAALVTGDLEVAAKLGAEIVGRPTSYMAPPAGLEQVPQIGSPPGMGSGPDFEKIFEIRPELLLGPASLRAHLAQLEDKGIKVLLFQPRSVEDVKLEILTVGKVLGKEDEAKKLVGEIDSKIAALRGKVSGKRVLVVWGAPGTYLAALPSSVLGDYLTILGSENVAKDFPPLPDRPTFASLSPELVVDKDPEVILLAAHGRPDEVRQNFLKDMESHPAWRNVKAVKENRVYVLPPEFTTMNPGPKVADALALFADALEGKLPVSAPAGGHPGGAPPGGSGGHPGGAPPSGSGGHPGR
ncbi:ABC transporter substrate-binding protein [Brockia lithotrophica]|uniref:Iron complex transport system substrate-binding protein n=1 Tax=Brockia lithotrophica TaxID=933949 RepID=A0A660KZU9_9BACL|nr:ABC transporter substrate-binding protein [Brockia lithotrophica]RKQ83600.1 iron complex transport system substrate-binding protein [Brockia lithotrophica]